MGREKRDIVYSVIIILLIPLLLAVNTLLIISSVRKDFNTELRRKADIVNTVIAETVRTKIVDSGTDNKVISELISSIKNERPEIYSVRVSVRDDSNKFAIAASTKEGDSLTSTDALQYDIVSTHKQAVAKFIEVTVDNASNRAWEVATPVIIDDQVVAIVSSSLLTGDVQQLVDKTFTKAFIVVIASIIVTFALLAYHFKFIAYADLLRKQKEVNQTMTDFLSVATHELKAPMTVIKGYVASTLDGDFGDMPENAKEPLTTVLTQTDRLANLVTDLLNISRIEQGKLTFDMKPVPIGEIIAMIKQNYTQKAAEKNIEIIYDPGTSQYVYADAGRVQEIMINLIDNAIKYSVKGTVTITHSVEKTYLKTSVRDTGIGMSADERARLFQRFYRVKNEQTKNISGTGLGLWIIKQYIEKMGGKIEVDSLVGTGTEFNVWLKITNAPQQAE